MKNRERMSWLFWIALFPLAFIPFIIWWSVTPTNILNSNPMWEMLEFIGIIGIQILFLFSIPVGIIGIRKYKKLNKLSTATKVLSIINLCIGIISVVLVLVILCAVIFFGLSV